MQGYDLTKDSHILHTPIAILLVQCTLKYHFWSLVFNPDLFKQPFYIYIFKKKKKKQVNPDPTKTNNKIK